MAKYRIERTSFGVDTGESVLVVLEEGVLDVSEHDLKYSLIYTPWEIDPEEPPVGTYFVYELWIRRWGLWGVYECGAGRFNPEDEVSLFGQRNWRRTAC